MVYGTRFTRSFIPVLCMVVVIVDMVAMFHIILLWNYPYVIPTFHVVIIHRLFFLVTRFTRLLVGCAQLFLLPYRTNTSKNISQKEKMGTCKNYYSLVLFPLVVV